MDLAAFRQLLTPAGAQALEAAQAREPREEDFLRHFAALSRSLPAGLARAALETAILRQEARAKFSQAERLFFTRAALEQASGSEISAFRARRYAGFTRVLDLGCSIGGDTLALAAVAPALGVDRDPLRLALAQANLQALGLTGRAHLVQADLGQPLPCVLSKETALFFDPARRDARGRIHSVQAYHPPLSSIHAWLERCPALGVKLSPGVELAELAAYREAEIEFISLRGELKEAVLWFGALHSGAARRAVLLPGPHILCAGENPEPEARLSEPLEFLYEPDPAILRAGLVRPLAQTLDAWQLDPEIAYLTAHRLQVTPFARAWQVEAWFPFNLKRLRAELRARQVGAVTVKKRGSPLEPQALIHELRLKGSRSCVVFLTQLRSRPLAILAQPAAASQISP